MFLVYLASTLYHALFATRAKQVFQHIDRSAIYVFIAGCYTPFALVSLRGPLGYGLLATVWTLAVVGVVLECVLRHRFYTGSMFLYLGMGWLALPMIASLVCALPVVVDRRLFTKRSSGMRIRNPTKSPQIYKIF